jgi:tRNA-guanine transglycosylase
MSSMFEYNIIAKDKKTRARTATFQTNYQLLKTPELAIVATDGQLKSITNEFWTTLPSQYIIVNTFHISTKKLPDETEDKRILDRVFEKGGIHKYMNLTDRTISSDSGGFQVFSLGFGKSHGIGKVSTITDGQKIEYEDGENPLKISEEGVLFEYDGKPVKLTPEISMDIQHKIGADMMFAFDECTSPLNSKEYTANSLERTFRWLDRCISAHKSHSGKQALFPVVQGGIFEDLRKKSATVMGKKDVPGFGLGGSFGKQGLYTVLDWIMPLLPEEKPKHLLGIGTVRDIFEGVERGVDLFDCVIPTREARHKMVYTKKGRLYMRKLKTLNEVIDPACPCFACTEKVTYAQLWDLYTKYDPKGVFYTTSHNIWFFSILMKEIREAIENGSLAQLKEEYLRYY